MKPFSKYFFTSILSTLFVLSIDAQYYVQKFLEDEVRTGRVRTIVEDVNNSSLVIKAGLNSEGIPAEYYKILKFDNHKHVSIIKDFTSEDQWASILGRTLKLHDSKCYYSMRDINISSKNPDSVGWNYGVLDFNGTQLIDKKIPLKLVNNSVYLCYGLELVKNDEVILWGVGIPPDRDPQKNDPYLIWVRLKRNGNLVSGPNYYKPPSVTTWAQPTDAVLDTDSTIVLVYDSRRGVNEKYILKIREDDRVETVVRMPLVISGSDDQAKLCVTRDSHYIVTNYHEQNGRLPVLTKMSRYNQKIWESSFDIPEGWWEGFYQRNIQNIYTNRIIEAKNGDIIMCGSNSVVDSFYSQTLNTKVLSGNNASSFIARFSKTGELLWRHFLVDLHDKGTLNLFIIHDIIESSDGNIVVGGVLGVKNFPGTSTPFIMKLGSNGCFDNQCSHVDKWWYFPQEISSVNDFSVIEEQLVVYPNPVTEKFSILFPESLAESKILKYFIKDTKGQTHVRGILKTDEPTITTQFLPSGRIFSLFRMRKENGGRLSG